ncbi:MAG TPA: hypothetical protein VIT19_11660 [Pyrinomonadaceae bacterium]
MSNVALLVVFACQSVMAQEPPWWTAEKKRCNLPSGLALETWKQQGGPCNDGASSPPPVDNRERERQLELELEQQRQLQRQQEEIERKRKANEADRRGLDAANRGRWKEAANLFIQALGYAPGNAAIRSHLDRANLAIADVGSAAEILALRQRIEDAIATANLEAARQQMEDEVAVQRLAALSESFRAQIIEDRRVNSTRPEPRRAQVFYPVLLKPVSPSNPSARVLAQYQPTITEVDAQIHRTQLALRRLIESNTQSEEQRLEWTRESAEATTDAQNLGISLLLDLIGAHVDHLAETNKEEREQVFNRLLNRAEADGRKRSLHTAHGILLNRKEELDRLQTNLERVADLHDLRVKVQESENPTALESFWDLASRIKKVEELAGPGEDLIEAAYTIYRQAISFENLAVIQANQEKSLQAAAGLRRYINRLYAQKRALSKPRPRGQRRTRVSNP